MTLTYADYAVIALYLAFRLVIYFQSRAER